MIKIIDGSIILVTDTYDQQTEQMQYQQRTSQDTLDGQLSLAIAEQRTSNGQDKNKRHQDQDNRKNISPDIGDTLSQERAKADSLCRCALSDRMIEELRNLLGQGNVVVQ